jgi:hypothetical protein
MTITKTIHPPSGATAMIAATQADITALGWYYIPVVMLSATLALGVGLITNNIQRRYPVFWLTPDKIPSRRKDKVEASPAAEPTPSAAPPAITDTIRNSETEWGKDLVIISRSDIVVPAFLELENEHKAVIEEIQRLLGEHLNNSSGSSESKIDRIV